MTDDPEVTALLSANAHLLDAMRRLVTLGDRLAARATSGPTLTPDEARDARAELDAARETVERIDTLLTLRRQHLRPL
jgi:hypothetical protein